MSETPFQKFRRDYRKSDVIFEEGSIGNEMYIVHSGKVRLSTRDESGQKVTAAVVGRGSFFGEMALIDYSPRSATAVAEEDTCLIALDRAKFLYLIQQQPAFVFTIMHVLCKEIREANLRLAKFAGKEATS